MKLLYISVLISKTVLKEVQQKSPSYSGQAVQKFNRLLAEGLSKNGHQVKAFSTFYLPSKGLFWSHPDDKEKGVSYFYLSSPNFGLLRHVWILLASFFYILFWGMYNKKEKALICDVLNISSCMGAVTAARLIGLRRVGVVTDMPGLMVDRSQKTISKTHSVFNARMNKSFLGSFTHYVFLTEQMNEAINVKHRPYIVMEGLVDSDMVLPANLCKGSKRIVLYAGGLHERYGLKMLVEGFLKSNLNNTELWLFGSGPFVKELQVYSQQDSRIVYKGICPNDEVVEAEMKATLLVNPRPTHEEFTKYSFPSKNLEYMVSGTPVLTTILPGMPEEYYSYVYLFDSGETAEGYAQVLRLVLSNTDEELILKGREAMAWVIANKNNVKQTARIISLIGHIS